MCLSEMRTAIEQAIEAYNISADDQSIYSKLSLRESTYQKYKSERPAFRIYRHSEKLNRDFPMADIAERWIATTLVEGRWRYVIKDDPNTEIDIDIPSRFAAEFIAGCLEKHRAYREARAAMEQAKSDMHRMSRKPMDYIRERRLDGLT